MVEKNLGFGLDLMNYTEVQLLSTVEKALNDKEMRSKLKAASERIQKEDKISKIANRVAEYVENL